MSAPALIFIASLSATVVGMLWYSPFLLGKPWAKLKGHHFESKKDMRAYQRSMLPQYVGAFVASLIIAWTLWTLLGLMGISKSSGALLLGTILWAGLVIPSTFSSALFDKKPLKLWAIDAGCAYVSMMTIVIVIQTLR
jgi:hypothetical protein